MVFFGHCLGFCPEFRKAEFSVPQVGDENSSLPGCQKVKPPVVSIVDGSGCMAVDGGWNECGGHGWLEVGWRWWLVAPGLLGAVRLGLTPVAG